MVNISKKELKQKELTSLFVQFNNALGNLPSKESKLFLDDLLGKEEQIMLAKRLAAILMLSHGQSLYKVADALKISSSTAREFQLKLEQEEYKSLLLVLSIHKKSYSDLLSTIDSILHLGGALPRYGQARLQ